MPMSGHTSGSAVVGVTLAMTILAAMVVILRLTARLLVVRNAGLDNAFIAAALLFSIATTVTMILQVKWGMGGHIDTLSLHESIESQKAFYVSIWVYNLSMSCTKFSILLQYLRIFPQRLFRRACHIMLVIVSIYTAWTFFSAVFACWPISYFWTQIQDPSGGKCLNRFAVWFANAGVNIATDIGIGLLPLRVLKELELPKRQRVALMVVFGLGGFTCVVSILRLESLYVVSKAKDVTWENPLAAIWSSVECNTGILCSCLPTLRSCVTRFFPKLLGTFRSSPSNSDAQNKQEEGESGEGESGGSSSTGTKFLSNSHGSRAADKDKRKNSIEALGRGLSNWGDARQSSHIHSGGTDGSSSEEIDMAYLNPMSEGGRIQVTTVVEQDVQQVEGAYDSSESMRSLVRPIRLVCGSEESLNRAER